MGTIFGRASGSNSNRETKSLAMKKIFLIICVFVGLAAIGCRSDISSFNQKKYERYFREIPDSSVLEYLISIYQDQLLENEKDYLYLIRFFEVKYGGDECGSEGIIDWTYDCLIDNPESQQRLSDYLIKLDKKASILLQIKTFLLSNYVYYFLNNHYETQVSLSDIDTIVNHFNKDFVLCPDCPLPKDTLQAFILSQFLCEPQFQRLKESMRNSKLEE